MQSLARDGYTEQEVKDVLHGRRGSRAFRFRYKLLDKNENEKFYLNNVESGEVSMSQFDTIKRTAKFRIKDDGTPIDWLTDRIQPIVEVQMFDGKWIGFPLGIFLLKSPTKSDEEGGIIREVEAYDGLVVLRDDKFTSRYHIPAGTNYKDAIIAILQSAGITKYNIADTDKTLPVDKEFEIGTEKIAAINELLSAINFIPLIVDPNGYYTTYAYQSPQYRGVDYSYADDSLSVMYKGMTEELDLWDVPNKWVAVLSDAERDPIVSMYENSNPDSPTSTTNMGRSIVRLLEVQDIADQAALDQYVERVAFESSQVYGKLEFNTAIMPHHDYADVLEITYSKMGINKQKYVETGWTIPLKVGEPMRHEVRRVVNI